MVLYFSASGNTKFAAETIAEKLGDRTLDLTDRIKRQSNILSRIETKSILLT